MASFFCCLNSYILFSSVFFVLLPDGKPKADVAEALDQHDGKPKVTPREVQGDTMAKWAAKMTGQAGFSSCWPMCDTCHPIVGL